MNEFNYKPRIVNTTVSDNYSCLALYVLKDLSGVARPVQQNNTVKVWYISEIQVVILTEKIIGDVSGLSPRRGTTNIN